MPYLVRVGGSPCLDCLCKIRILLNSCFPSGRLEFGYVPSRGCLRDQPIVKALGTESLMSFPGWQHFTCVATTCYWGI